MVLPIMTPAITRLLKKLLKDKKTKGNKWITRKPAKVKPKKGDLKKKEKKHITRKPVPAKYITRKSKRKTGYQI